MFPIIVKDQEANFTLFYSNTWKKQPIQPLNQFQLKILFTVVFSMENKTIIKFLVKGIGCCLVILEILSKLEQT